MYNLQEIVNQNATKVKYIAIAALTALTYAGCGSDNCETDKDCLNGEACQQKCTESTYCGETRTSCGLACVEEGTSQSDLITVEHYICGEGRY